MGITAIQLITIAGRKARILGSGETFDGDEAVDALVALKMMLDSWALESLMIPYLHRETFALDGSGSYTLGPGGDWDTAAPIEIKKLLIIDAAGYEWVLDRAPLNQWTMLEDKGVIARPTFYYLERGYPLQTVRLNSLPVEPTVRIWSEKPLEVWQIEDLSFPTPNPNFAGQKTPTSALDDSTLTADIEFDVGYEQAIIYNLAIHLAADYNRELNPIFASIAISSKLKIKDRNLEVPIARIDQGLPTGRKFYDIQKGP